jgi:hypothetical protein
MIRMSKFRKLMAILGVSAVGAGLVLAFRPSILGGSMIPHGLRGMLPVYLILLLLGIYGIASFRVRPRRTGLFLNSGEYPEMVVDRSEDLKIDFNHGEESEEREEFRSTVKRILEEEKGLSEDEAEEEIETGGWTSDRVSAAFIDSSVKYPLLERLRDWLEEKGTFERRVDRTVKSVEKLHEEGKDGT